MIGARTGRRAWRLVRRCPPPPATPCSRPPPPCSVRRPLSSSSSQSDPSCPETSAAPENLPERANIVIVGAGAQGAAIAYKLAERGYGPGTVVIDQGTLGGGSTAHSSGIVGQLANSPLDMRLSKLSRELCLELQSKGYSTGWRQVGSIHVATHPDRVHHFKRLKSMSVREGVECELIEPGQVKEMVPLLKTDDVRMALWVPGDGVADPREICKSLAAVAKEKGVAFVENCALEEVMIHKGAVRSLRTSLGHIQCNTFVNCAGFWARRVGFGSTPRVNIPLHPAEHYYLRSKPTSELSANMPVIHDPDAHVYFREFEGRLLGGGFEPMAKPTFEDGILPDKPSTKQPKDWDHFYLLLKGILHRIPFISDVKLGRLVNSPEAFSPDGKWILGKAPEVDNYFVAAAMRSLGIGAAGGVGDVLASYIIDGAPPFDLNEQDLQRFLVPHNNRKFLRDRVREVPGLFYAIPYPFPEFQTGRSLRTSPIFTKLQEAGARFSQVMGYERAMYFKKPEDVSKTNNSANMVFFGLGAAPPPPPKPPVKEGGLSYEPADRPIFCQDPAMDPDSDETGSMLLSSTRTFFKPPWFNEAEKEFQATRNNVSVCDYSSFAKFDIWSAGTEVVEFLQYICSNDVDVPVGSIVHTGMHNKRGGYENDCSVTRLAFNRFMIMSPSVQQMRSYSWIKSHLPKDGSIFLQDVTCLYTTLCVMGPKSLELMSILTESDLSLFPKMTCRHLDVACAPDILTLNMTHTGEHGYVIYIPSEFAIHVLDAIMEAGKSLGVQHCGYYAMHAIRIEKFFAFWGQDLDSYSTPFECGRAFRIKMENQSCTHQNLNFIGKEAMLKQKQEGVKKLLVMLLLDAKCHDTDTDPWPWGGEPFFRDGQFCGHVTTAAYGFTIGRQVCLGFVHNFGDGKEHLKVDPAWVKSGRYEVEIAGSRYPAEIKLTAPVLPSVASHRSKPEVPTRHQLTTD